MLPEPYPAFRAIQKERNKQGVCLSPINANPQTASATKSSRLVFSYEGMLLHIAPTCIYDIVFYRCVSRKALDVHIADSSNGIE